MAEVYVVVLVVCVLGSAFSSGSETALVSASRLQLRRLSTDGHRGAAMALGLLNERDRTLAVTLIVTNAFNVSAGAITTALLSSSLGPSVGPMVATVVATGVLLVLAEIVPKAYFRHHADAMLMHTAVTWRGLSVLLLPFTYPGHLFTQLFYRLLKREPRSFFTTREEIKLVLEESAEQGGLHEHEQEMLESALEYSETTSREVMVPIGEVALLREGARTSEFLELVRERGYTRIPLYREERVDQIAGLVNVFDVLYDPEPKTFVRAYMRPARLVPDSKPIDVLFLEMQRERENLVVVVSEFGSCIGVVSTEDIVEEIFGELTDEHEDATPEIRKLGPGHFRITARTDIDDLNHETGWAIPEGDYQTVGGYVLHRLGRVPKKGELFTEGRLRVRVVDADRYSVRMVEIQERRKKIDRSGRTPAS
jgi:CBS domain containing-hemolysin-like protein